jgi:hypothetical protein
MAASLPPSSSTTGVRFRAAAAITFLPVGTLPVKTIFPTRGSSTNAAATASSTATTFTTPSGIPALRHSSPMRRPTRVVAGAGFKTTVLPAASAAATPESEMANG